MDENTQDYLPQSIKTDHYLLGLSEMEALVWQRELELTRKRLMNSVHSLEVEELEERAAYLAKRHKEAEEEAVCLSQLLNDPPSWNQRVKSWQRADELCEKMRSCAHDNVIGRLRNGESSDSLGDLPALFRQVRDAEPEILRQIFEDKAFALVLGRIQQGDMSEDLSPFCELLREYRQITGRDPDPDRDSGKEEREQAGPF